jgi:hypothetical protein
MLLLDLAKTTVLQDLVSTCILLRLSKMTCKSCFLGTNGQSNGHSNINGNSDGNDESHSNGHAQSHGNSHAHGTVRFLSRYVTSRLHDSNVIFTVN